MTSINIRMSEDEKELLYESHATLYGYIEQIENEAGELMPNPESRDEFARRMILEHLSSQWNEVARASQVSETPPPLIVLTD